MTLALTPAELVESVVEPAGVDPFDELVERVRPWAAEAVDALQITAALESEGVTDAIALSRYGRADVFELADDVYRRLTPRPAARPGPVGGQDRARAAREVAHGLLYLLPSAAFPPALALIGSGSLVLVIALAGAVGWVWSSVASWLAYQFLGAERPGSAAVVLRWSALYGLPVAGGVGLAVAAATGAGFGLLGLAVAMMAYQMASTLLIFYRRELWLGLAMVPGVLAGGAYLAVGPDVTPWAVGAAGVSTVAAFGLGLALTVGATRRARTRRPGGSAPTLTPLTVALVTLYSGLAAAFLLHAQAPYLLTRLDVVLAFGPLLGGMGVVEWRSRRYAERASDRLMTAAEPADFDRAMRRALVLDTILCMAAVAALALPLLAGLAVLDRLSDAAIVMAAAGVILGGAYFLSFVLAGQGGFGRLGLALALATAVHVGGAALLPGGALPDLTAFLGGCLLLEVTLATMLAGSVGQAWRYRINQGDECTP